MFKTAMLPIVDSFHLVTPLPWSETASASQLEQQVHSFMIY